ncbi:leucine-rich repeat protein kinase family protein [Actinidia rufa]|uniref:Leucine-rich repeat protein kinase family protein n=1 Tax=Actinidia rufa TaxID=165716 RepID=A0A7J0EDE4_9ERIC|nr:leucine-rich repeat protein kinase family protein [Actinidia rufa]
MAASLPSLGNCKNLLSLSLAQNKLSGSIPPLVIGLSSLSDLYFSKNYLTGSLPLEVGLLKNLGYLNVSENKLSSEIPGTLGSCVRLETPRVEGNLFHGTIPTYSSSLSGLQILDLSRNSFSGRIPEFLEGFNFLQILNMSNNDFEGAVRTEGVFANASAVSVMGNSKLCGDVPELQLSLCISKGSRNRRLSVTSKLTENDHSSVSPTKSLFKVSYQTLLHATGEFSSENLIGVGGLGSVYKGIIQHDGTIVAIKVLNLQQCGASKSFIAECEALRNIKHRNFVKDMTGHVGDFGLARFLGKATPTIYTNQGSSIGVRVFIGYTAPDYAMGSEVSAKEDIYSYGILLLEMFMVNRPTDDMFQDSTKIHNYVKKALPYRVGEVADPLLLRGGEEKTQVKMLGAA